MTSLCYATRFRPRVNEGPVEETQVDLSEKADKGEGRGQSRKRKAGGLVPEQNETQRLHRSPSHIIIDITNLLGNKTGC